MTMKELSQLHWLNLEIEHDQRRLAELTARATSPGGPNMSGMPGGGGAGSSVESAALEIVELKAIISAKMEQAKVEYKRLTAFIMAVDDSFTREVFWLRFVDGLPWEQVAASMGAGFSGDAVRKVCKRYMDKCPIDGDDDMDGFGESEN